MAMLPRYHRPQDAKAHLVDFLLKESPKDPELLELLGQSYALSGKYVLAKEAFKKSIENSPTQLTAYQKLADMLRKQEVQPEADQWMEKLVKNNPKSAKAHFLRARYLSISGKIEEAFPEAMQAQALDPDDAEILRLAAMCYASKGQLNKARECLTHAIKLHPDAIILYNTLCTVERQAGDSDKAVDTLQKGLKATGRNLYLLWSLADLYVDMGKLKESQDDPQRIANRGLSQGLDRVLAGQDRVCARALVGGQKQL